MPSALRLPDEHILALEGEAVFPNAVSGNPALSKLLRVALFLDLRQRRQSDRKVVAMNGGK